MQDLMVLHDDNSIFSNYSKEAKDFLRDDFTINYTVGEDSIYIGLYKPFGAFYVEMALESQGNLSFTINGNGVEVDDDTQSFSRSGFIEISKPSDWIPETINGIEAYWLKIDSDQAMAPVFRGINMVFADDNDMAEEFRDINRYMAKSDTSFIAYHLAARNEIVQTLRNGGRTKLVDDLTQNITKWDVLDFGEIRQAAKYLALSKLFFDISENVDDKHYFRHRGFEGMFGKAFDLYILSLDQNDDGEYVQEDDLVFNGDITIEVI